MIAVASDVQLRTILSPAVVPACRRRVSLKQSFLGGCKMSESGDENEPLVQPSLPRFSTIAVRVVVLVAVCTTATLIYASFHAHSFSSFTSRGLHSGRAFFIFGDSYADVGNIPGGPASVSPYGTSWPGHPTGRFSDGYVQPDYLATQIPGCQSPSAFAKSNVKTLLQGANFAVGGAGLTYAFGLPTIITQVSWFESIVKSGIYTKEFLASSVTLLCASGNDYLSYQGDLENYVAFGKEVVRLIGESLLKLYSLGLRNIMVTTLAPMNCLPLTTVLTNFTTCVSNETMEAVQSLHNVLLATTLGTLSKELSGINFVLLRQGDALKQIQTNMTLYNVSEPIQPCCLGRCGEVDRSGNLLYTLCGNPENYVLWDEVHPTQAAWENVVKLYVNDEAYTTFVPTLGHWTQKLS